MPREEEISLEEQLARRQSAPRPTIEEEAARIAEQNPIDLSAAAPVTQPIGREQVQAATQILQRYKQGKANLDQRIRNNQEWYRLRHWDVLRQKKAQQVEPYSGWLFNAIANKHADAMDNFPSPNILPREQSDKPEAEILSKVIPVILDQTEFEQAYADEWDDKLVGGTGVYGVFWDSSKLNGLGDISIKACDILSIFWEPGITDIQSSHNLFTVELVDNEDLYRQYPNITPDSLSNPTVTVTEYVHDDSIDTNGKSAVIDWYYKKVNEAGQTVLHYCKYVNDIVLASTENDPATYPQGLYEHGKYPFVFDPLFREKDTPCGFGYADVAKSAQEYIDRTDQAVLRNVLANAKPRHFIRNDGSVNEEEYADTENDLVHVDGNLGDDSIRPIPVNPLSPIYVESVTRKVEELKEVTGNRDVNTGGSTSGITAAAAIAALQESGSKLSRDHIKASYRVFKKLILQVIELIRQFYTAPRFFRVLGEMGVEAFVVYSNERLRMQQLETMNGMDMAFRLPVFDVEVSAQKSSPYSKMAQNELALQFYSARFFDPMMADQAIACLTMMDFDHKDEVMQIIAQNQMRAMAAMAAMMPPPATSGGTAQMPKDEAGSPGEAPTTRNARQRVADSTSPT